MEHEGIFIDTGLPGGEVLLPPVGREQVREAYRTFQKYRQGKLHLEQRIIANERWYRLRHWDELRRGGDTQVEPTSAWLFNALQNKHADVMDNYPSLNILPREESDRQEARLLSSIMPVVMEQVNFEQTYHDVNLEKLKNGTGVYGVFWDPSALGGLGDIAIHEIDLLNLFWEPGIRDIQRSRNVFHVELMDNDLLEAQYPQLAGKLGSAAGEIAAYIHDESIDTTGKSAVFDWYYKRTVGGRTVLHLCKFVGEEVLFASENEARYALHGWYHHGRYPFHFDVLFPDKGMPTGFGYIDVGRSPQEYIDRLDQAIQANVLANAVPRHFIREDGGINEEEYLDVKKPLIHVSGSLGEDTIRTVPVNPLPAIYVQTKNNKIDELKETTGNRDISAGGTVSGVTAASAIAAMQEAGGKLSRNSNKSAYRTYRQVALTVIELIRQFYTLPRTFRIVGADGNDEFVSFDNGGMQPQRQYGVGGEDMGLRLPLYDIQVVPQKASPYSKLSQNELALQFYGAGFFLPQNADQALACLNMMDFDGKQAVVNRVSQNGSLYQTVQALQQQLALLTKRLDAQNGGAAVSDTVTAQLAAQPTAAHRGKTVEAKKLSAVEKARQRAAEAATPF